VKANLAWIPAFAGMTRGGREVNGGFCVYFVAWKTVLHVPVDKPLDIHSVQCAELVRLYTGEFLSNNDPNWIQCFSG
jgi:hypothetical protein